jgi:hypothetical protein
MVSNDFDFTFDIEDITDLNIDLDIPGGLILWRSGNPTSTASIIVQNATGLEFEWRYRLDDDTFILGTQATLTLSVDPVHPSYKVDYDLIGHHIITLVVWRDGVPYSKRINFEVRP